MKTILVIDDLAVVRLYHTRFLAQNGYRCLEAANGADALALLRTQPVDLALLDLVMPDMNGATFLSTIRADAGLRRLPVIAITSEALKGETRRLTDLHQARVLLKPLLPGDLLREVQSVVGATV